MTFPENLRRLRVDRFFSQGELARRAGMHPITLTRLEAGVSDPSARSVRALADALGVEPGELATPNEVAELRRVLKAVSKATVETAGRPGVGTPHEQSALPASDGGDADVQYEAPHREDGTSHE